MSGICYIMGAGDFFPDKDNFIPNEDDYVIAADGGYLSLRALSITPDLILGDMDSLADSEAKRLTADCTKNGQPIKLYPVRKDDSDMMLAIQCGLERGYRTFYLYGGTGGRMDHTIANLQALAYLASQDAIGYLMGSQNVSTIIKEKRFVIPSEVTGYVSVFAYGGTSTGIDYTGMSYPLHNATLTTDNPLGVSNQVVAPDATITVKKGLLLILWER